MQRAIITCSIILLVILLTVTSTLAVVFFIQSNNRQNEINQLHNDNQNLQTQIDGLKKDLSAKPTTSTSNTGSDSNTTAVQCTSKSTDGKIIVTSPCPNATLTYPFKITGSANVFESTVSIKIYDDKMSLQYTTSANTDATDAGKFGDFTKTVVWSPNGNLTTGFIQVSEISAKDGTDASVVKIPVKFQ